MMETSVIQEVILKILYQNELNDEVISFNELLTKISNFDQNIDEKNLKKELYDGQSKDYFRWKRYLGTEFADIQIGSIGILIHEESLEKPLFFSVGIKILEILNNKWNVNPSRCDVEYKKLLKEINEMEDEQIKTALFWRIGRYLEDLGMIDRKHHYFWTISNLGRNYLKEFKNKSIKKEKYTEPQDVEKHQAIDKMDKIENCIHKKIEIILKDVFPDNRDWWFEGIPERIRIECSKKYEKAKGQGKVYDYTDIVELKEIIDKNWKHFINQKPFSNFQSNKKAFLRSIDELNILRNNVKHPTRKYKPTEQDFSFLDEFLKDLEIK